MNVDPATASANCGVCAAELTLAPTLCYLCATPFHTSCISSSTPGPATPSPPTDGYGWFCSVCVEARGLGGSLFRSAHCRLHANHPHRAVRKWPAWFLPFGFGVLAGACQRHHGVGGFVCNFPSSSPPPFSRKKTCQIAASFTTPHLHHNYIAITSQLHHNYISQQRHNYIATTSTFTSQRHNNYTSLHIIITPAI